MGLTLVVGFLAELREHDPDGADELSGQFTTMNRYLESTNQALHQEPKTCSVWSADMFGYSGLHTLRRLAAHLDAGMPMPPPGDRSSSGDAVLERYFEEEVGQPAGWLAKLFQRRPKFARDYDHLILHSDAEGFYLPSDFRDVQFPPEEYDIPGGMIGSVPRLAKELARLSQALKIPPELTSQSPELWEAADTQGQGAELWSRYGVESFSCVVLMEGCKASMETGAALVFC